jgi:hypothetical protein
LIIGQLGLLAVAHGIPCKGWVQLVLKQPHRQQRQQVGGMLNESYFATFASVDASYFSCGAVQSTSAQATCIGDEIVDQLLQLYSSRGYIV